VILALLCDRIRASSASQPGQSFRRTLRLLARHLLKRFLFAHDDAGSLATRTAAALVNLLLHDCVFVLRQQPRQARQLILCAGIIWDLKLPAGRKCPRRRSYSPLTSPSLKFLELARLPFTFCPPRQYPCTALLFTAFLLSASLRLTIPRHNSIPAYNRKTATILHDEFKLHDTL